MSHTQKAAANNIRKLFQETTSYTSVNLNHGIARLKQPQCTHRDSKKWDLDVVLLAAVCWTNWVKCVRMTKKSTAVPGHYGRKQIDASDRQESKVSLNPAGKQIYFLTMSLHSWQLLLALFFWKAAVCPCSTARSLHGLLYQSPAASLTSLQRVSLSLYNHTPYTFNVLRRHLCCWPTNNGSWFVNNKLYSCVVFIS